MSKRVATRFSMQLPVSVKYTNGGFHERFGHTKDISAGGIFFSTTAEISEGAELELVVPVPPPLVGDGKVWLLCQAKVVRVERNADGTLGIGAAVARYEVLKEA